MTEPDQDTIRGEILDRARDYWAARPTPEFVAGETYVPVSGKVLDAEDLVHLLDASLDMWLTAGRYTQKFEKTLARTVGVRKSRLTVSGSAANLLALTALTSHRLKERAIKAGDEVITVAAGFPTTVAPILQNHCVPVFVDVELETHNIDVTQLEAALSPKTRAIMIAHTLGNPFNLDVVVAFAKKHDLFLVEDSCDALGTTYRGENVGTFGDVATLSFYPAHHITTGEGGALLTNRPLLARVIESFRDWGRDCWCQPGTDNTCGKRFDWQLGGLPEGYDHKYIYSHIGYNLKATDMQAAIGCSQLEKLDLFTQKRRHNHARLKEGMLNAGLDEFLLLPEAQPNSEPSWFGFAATVRDGSVVDRNKLIRMLEAQRVGTRLLFAGNLLRQPAFQDIDCRTVGELPMTDKVMNDSFWIGVWPGLDDQRIDYMIDTVNRVVRELAG